MNPATSLQALYRDIRGRETVQRTAETHLDAAIDWLCRSQDVTDCGGSAAYYSLLTGWAGPYPETSGYIVPTLFDYAALADAPAVREHAEQMAAWLLETQLDSGAFPGGVDLEPGADPSVFNTGQILFGLVRAHRETGEERFLQAADHAAAWLVDVQHKAGYWDRFDYRGEIHSYCSRVAWALLQTAAVTNDDRYQDAAVSHLSWVVSVQIDEDWFEFAGFSPDEVPFLHTIAYTVRGLLEGGLWLDNEEFIAAARATADRLLTEQGQAGPLLGAYDRFWVGRQLYCLTGNAQMAVIWARLHEWSGDRAYLDAANRELGFLFRQQTLDGPSAIDGAFRGSNPVWGPYMRLRYPSWAAKFFCDAVMATGDLYD